MAHDAALLPVMDSGGCRDDMETDGGAGGCTPRAGKVGPRSNPGPYFLTSGIRRAAPPARRPRRHQPNAITNKLEQRITRLAAATARNQEDARSRLPMVPLPHGGPA